jgi:hypothetical protein
VALTAEIRNVAEVSISELHRRAGNREIDFSPSLVREQANAGWQPHVTTPTLD